MRSLGWISEDSSPSRNIVPPQRRPQQVLAALDLKEMGKLCLIVASSAAIALAGFYSQARSEARVVSPSAVASQTTIVSATARIDSANFSASAEGASGSDRIR